MIQRKLLGAIIFMFFAMPVALGSQKEKPKAVHNENASSSWLPKIESSLPFLIVVFASLLGREAYNASQRQSNNLLDPKIPFTCAMIDEFSYSLDGQKNYESSWTRCGFHKEPEGYLGFAGWMSYHELSPRAQESCLPTNSSIASKGWWSDMDKNYYVKRTAKLQCASPGVNKDK